MLAGNVWHRLQGQPFAACVPTQHLGEAARNSCITHRRNKKKCGNGQYEYITKRSPECRHRIEQQKLHDLVWELEGLEGVLTLFSCTAMRNRGGAMAACQPFSKCSRTSNSYASNVSLPSLPEASRGN